MPVLGPRGLLVLGAVMLALPLQHLLGNLDHVSLVASAREALHRLERLIDWLEDVADKASKDTEGSNTLQVGLADRGGGVDNSSAAEHFATSTKPRRRRPQEVLYRVGQVVFHRQLEVRGVVMGWDVVAKAPLHWLKQVYSLTESQPQDILEEPHYTVICDVVQIPSVENEVHYFAQSQLDDDGAGGVVTNSLLENVFLGYSEEKGVYKLSPQLKRLYPID